MTAHRQAAFWGASCLIAFALAFVLGSVWRSHHVPSATFATVAMAAD